MKKINIKKIVKIIVLVIFIYGLLFIGKYSISIISDNIKSKDYAKAFAIYKGDKTYTYFVEEKSYECKANIYKRYKFSENTTVKYDKNNPEKCVVTLTNGTSYITIWLIITFIMGSILIIMKRNERNKAKK